MVHVIVYDLMRPGQAYNEVHDYITRNAGQGLWQHPEGSVWLVDSTATATRWRDCLSEVTDTNDKIVVMTLGGAGAWVNHPGLDAWINSPTRRWQ